MIDLKSIVANLKYYTIKDGKRVPYKLTDDEFAFACAVIDTHKYDATVDEIWVELLKSADRPWSRDEVKLMIERMDEIGVEIDIPPENWVEFEGSWNK